MLQLEMEENREIRMKRKGWGASQHMARKAETLQFGDGKAEEHISRAKKIMRVMDKLNTKAPLTLNT